MARVLLGCVHTVGGAEVDMEPGQSRHEIEAAIPAICEALAKFTNHNFLHYKNSTLRRRVQRRMQVLKFSRVAEYLDLLQQREDEVQTLFRELLIGVTAFFRDEDVFEAVRQRVLPKLLENREPGESVRLWVAGCANGAEAYSLAMLCREALDGISEPPLVQVFATDIDERALETARRGIYPLAIEEQIAPERLKRFFIKKSRHYQVAKEIRDLVLFSTHNLISDPPFSRLDLISCRNLLIYLGMHLQNKLIPLFHYALRPAGYLLLGPSENIASHSELFRPVDARLRISQKKASAVGSAAPLALRAVPAAQLSAVARQPDDAVDLTAIRQRIILDEFAPKSCIINESGQIMNSSANIHKYLQISDGDFQNNIFKMAASGLRMGLRAALTEARQTHSRVQHSHVSIREGNCVQQVMLTVQSLAPLGENEPLYLVVFHDVGLPSERDVLEVPAASSSSDASAMMAQMERELETVRQDLDKSLQDMEATNEELKSSNEELLSMNEELQSANEELETSKEEIRASSEAVARANSDLENLLRSTQIATVFLDNQLQIRSFTPAISAIYNLISADVGRPLQQFVPSVIGMPPLPEPQSLREGESLEHTVVAHSGKSYIRRVLPYRTHTGEADGIVVTFIDVSELAESEKKLKRSLLAGNMDAFQVDLRKMRIERFGPLTQTLCLTDNPHDFFPNIHPDDREAFHQAYQSRTPSDPIYHVFYRYRGPDGEYQWLKESAEVVFNAQGQATTVAGICQIVTHQKQAELNRIAALARLDMSLAASKAAAWNWDRKTNQPVVNETMKQMFGFEPHQSPGFEDFVARFHEADRQRVQQANLRAIREGGHYEQEYRISLPTGETRWLRAVGQAVLSNDGRLEDFFGVAVDISAQKHRENELTDREAHLRRVIDHMLGFVGVLDADGTLMEANQAALTAGGLTRDDVIGKPFWECNWWNWDTQTVQKLRSAIDQAKAGQVVRCDAQVRMAGDSRIWIDFMLVPVTNAQGQVTHLIPSGVDITERLEAQRTVDEQRARLSMAMRAAHMGTFEWEPETDIARWDDAWCETVGIPIDAERRGQSLFQIIHPDDRDQVHIKLLKSLADGTPFEAEYRVRRGDGEYLWILSLGRFIADEHHGSMRMLGVEMDITARKRSEEELRLSSERLAVAASAAGFGTLHVDLIHGQVTFSPEMKALIGWPPEHQFAIAPGEIPPFIHPDDVPALREHWQVQLMDLGDAPVSHEHRIVRPDGSIRWVRLQSRTLFTGNGKDRRATQIIGTLLDITNQCEFEQSLETARHAAEQASEAKSMFVANISHEIRTPMTSILGYAELLQDFSKDPTAQEYLQTIRSNGRFLLDMINDILDLSKIESGKLEVVIERFALPQLVQEVRSIMQVRAAEKNLDFAIDFQTVVPELIESDAKRIKQILINLVGNAVKFTDRGQVRLGVRYVEHAGNLKQPSTCRLEFSIRDSGIGMTAEQVQGLFQPFSQGDASITRRFGGTGLGLAISRRLAHLLHGDITVESELGRGSIFTFTLGLDALSGVALITPEQPAPEVNSGTQVATPLLKNRRILCVDDRRDIRFLIKAILSKSGVQISEAEDGQIALSYTVAALRDGQPPDAILLDMQMPNLDGYETAQQLRASGYAGPIIALTADAMHSEMQRCIDCGCNDYLSKPINSTMLLEKLASLIWQHNEAHM